VGPLAVGGLNPRLLGWSGFVAFFTVVNYASRLLDNGPADDVAFRWESSISFAALSGIVLAIALLLSWGLDRANFLAFRRPSSWWQAVGISALVIVALFIVSAVVQQFGNPGKEQGLIPERFDSSRAAQFAAFATVVVVVVPIVEEIMFRGVGYALLEPFGRGFAVVVVGISFALVHGLVAGFLVIATFGVGLAYLRARTGSIYPCIALHSTFNAFGLAIGIATGS
jgi:membrane protease YdiL (CAAX protease family)